MYFQPYGDDQQLNLNWIINEIINLHKQLDPDYETPSFTQVYPYSNLNRLNLDWVLSELKALKELAPEPTPEIDIQAVAEALVALPFDSNTSYQIYDFISKDGEIWRATEAIAAGGDWDETKWFKTKLGTDLAVLERWINAINNSLTSLQNTVADLSSADISDDSDAGGATVKASLNNLKGSINDSIENSFSGLAMFNRIGVIGDSFASGGINPSGTSSQNTENSWIQIIGRKLGIAAVNYSRNAYNTQSFVNTSSQYYNTVGLGALLADIETKNACGCYIFAMGINDVSLGDSYLGSISDINTADPTQNPDTFYGNVGKIISNILTNTPNSKIIISTFYRPTTSAAEEASYNLFNAAIIAIANYFNLPYIDVRNDPYFKSEYYINNQKNRHPTLDMYVGYANAIMRLCSECIVSNNDYFYNYRNTDIYNDTYYHSGDKLTFDNTYAQWFGVATSTTELRIFIPFNKPVKATSFNITGGFLARSGANDAGIQGSFVESDPTGNNCVLGHQYIAENGIAFGITFASGVIAIRNLYAFQPSSTNPLVIEFT